MKRQKGHSIAGRTERHTRTLIALLSQRESLAWGVSRRHCGRWGEGTLAQLRERTPCHSDWMLVRGEDGKLHAMRVFTQ